MSAFGQKRTCAAQKVMSALPPKADMYSATRDVRFVPIAEISPLLDHLVGNGEHTRRYCEAELFGRSKIDNQFKLCRTDNW